MQPVIQTSKITQIAEILGIFEEINRGKDWLLERLKKRKIKVNNTLNSFEILKIIQISLHL